MSSPQRKVLGAQENVAGGVVGGSGTDPLLLHPHQHHSPPLPFSASPSRQHSFPPPPPPLPPLPPPSHHHLLQQQQQQQQPPSKYLHCQQYHDEIRGGGVNNSIGAATGVATGESTNETSSSTNNVNSAVIGGGGDCGGGGTGDGSGVAALLQQQQQPPQPPRSAFMCFTDARKKEIMARYSNSNNKNLEGGDSPPQEENGVGNGNSNKDGSSDRRSKTQTKKEEDVILKIVAEEWRKLSDRERAHWDEEARNDKVRFVREKAEYKGPLIVPKRRAKKDPRAPKRPMSAFLKFSQRTRASVKESNPDMSNTDVSRLLGEMWRNLSPSESAPYVEQEERERAAYKAKKREFDESKSKEDAATRTSHREAVGNKKNKLAPKKKSAKAGPSSFVNDNRSDASVLPEAPPHEQKSFYERQPQFLQPIPQQTPDTQMLVDSFFDQSGIDIPPPPPPPLLALPSIPVRVNSTDDHHNHQFDRQHADATHHAAASAGGKDRRKSPSDEETQHPSQPVFRPYLSVGGTEANTGTKASQRRLPAPSSQTVVISSSGSSGGGGGHGTPQQQQQHQQQYKHHHYDHHAGRHGRHQYLTTGDNINISRNDGGREGSGAASSASISSASVGQAPPPPPPPIRGTFRPFQAPPYYQHQNYHQPQPYHQLPAAAPQGTSDRYAAAPENDRAYSIRRYAPPPTSSISGYANPSSSSRQQPQQPPLSNHRNEDNPGPYMSRYGEERTGGQQRRYAYGEPYESYRR